MGFKNGTRLIVDFAIENLKAINARKKRELQSKLKNPTWKGREGYIGPDDTEQQDNKKKKKKKGDGEEKREKADFTGTIADPKIKTLPKHTGAKVRHNAAPKITRKDLRKQEQKRKDPNRKRIRTVRIGNTPLAPDEPLMKKPKKNAAKHSKQERKDEKENKAFDKLVSQYKDKMVSNKQVIK